MCKLRKEDYNFDWAWTYERRWRALECCAYRDIVFELIEAGSITIDRVDEILLKYLDPGIDKVEEIRCLAQNLIRLKEEVKTSFN